MSAAARIGGFAAVLAVAFAAAAFAGSRISPKVDEQPSHGEKSMSPHATESKEESFEHEGHREAAATSAGLPGLATAQDGYRLVVNERTLSAAEPQLLNFRIESDDGAIVTGFDVEHDRRMHLIVVRRDFQGFQHLHPEQKADGGWSVEVGSLRPGVYRVFSDFSTEGRALTLASDLFVPGPFDPEELAPATKTSSAGDGYEVSIGSPEAMGGATVPVIFEVKLNGRPIDTVEPYLGAKGHLVALREGDQAFLHTHPEGEPGGPGPISFEVNYPTSGRYRLYLQFKHKGKVHTAAFTQVAGLAERGHEGVEQHD